MQTVDWETKAFLDTKRFGAMQQMLQVHKQTAWWIGFYRLL